MMSAVIVTGSAAEEEYAVDTGSMMQAVGVLEGVPQHSKYKMCK